MKKSLIIGLSVMLCCLTACGQPAVREEQYTSSELEQEKQSSYDVGYEAGYQDGAEEGAHNPGDYLSSEEAKAAEEDWEDYFQEYAEENGYYKAN